MLFLGAFIILVVIFLLGISWMRIGLFNISGRRMEQWLKKVTNTPTKGMFSGIVMTSILQSSSAVMIITIGFVSTRLLLFPQTIGIILGTNIGTTLTLGLISFNLSGLVIPLIVAGLCCLIFKIVWIKSTGFVLIGFGGIFGAMSGFEKLATPLTNTPVMKQMLLLLDQHILYAFFIGVLITAIIQSSTVVTGIAMSFLNAGIFPLEIAIIIMLGANIGTCVTGLLASIGGGKEARLTAFAHVWLNVGGAVLCLPFITHLADVSRLMAHQPDVQLVYASILFNTLSSLIVLPFAVRFGQFVTWLHSPRIE
ncbi:Na/Pi symporter [Sporosarcina sp. G11-34]|nr:Na/Pi symporter [Sporosarcina sp. G11-34]